MSAPTKEQYEAASRVWGLASNEARVALVRDPDSPLAKQLKEAMLMARGEIALKS